MYIYVKTGYSDLLSMYSKTYYADVYDDTKTFALREYPDDVELGNASTGCSRPYRTQLQELITTAKEISTK